MSGLIVNIKRMHPDARVPRYETELAAGFDLVAVEDVIIAPGETALVPLGFAIEIPPGYEMQVRPRSGVSWKTKLRVSNSPGTVDGDFRGEVKVIVDNIERGEPGETPRLRLIDGKMEFSRGEYFEKYTYIIRKGDRIAQGVIAPIERVTFVVVDELSETARGSGGFGHTGTSANKARHYYSTYREEWTEVGAD